jgi:hypothetical protein
VLFRYRPRETWMPFGLPRGRTEQASYNAQLQQRFESTRRASPAPTQPRDPVDALTDLAALRASGVLTDAEFETAKSKLLAG